MIILSALALGGAPLRSYVGFDRNQYPGDDKLTALQRTFAYTGYWLNNPPGENTNTWSGKRAPLRAAGFGFLVLFNGRVYTALRGHKAGDLGHADAANAVQAAKREGFPQGTIIFLDQEEGGRLVAEQREYLHAWVDAVNASGFRAGVYCSGIPFREGNGTVVITASDIRENAGNRKIVYWVSNDACPPSPGCALPSDPPSPASGGVAFATVWQFAQSPRRAQQTSKCAATYNADGNCYAPGLAGGNRIHIDMNTATSPDPSHGR